MTRALRVILIGVGVFAVSAPSNAETAATPTASEAADPDRVVCKKIKLTGSRVSKPKVCMTAQQWAMEEKEAKTNLQKYQSNGSLGMNVGQ